MKLQSLLHDEKFNIFFSFLLGIGIICMLRPVCSGSECNVNKASSDKDFDKYVYRMGNAKCYEFKTEITDCPVSGAVEAFKDQFVRRTSPISQCE